MEKELEKAALIYASKPRKFGVRMTFIDGANWQAERMYSEEEVLEIIRQYALEEHLITSSKPDIWFEQFKKK